MALSLITAKALSFGVIVLIRVAAAFSNAPSPRFQVAAGVATCLGPAPPTKAAMDHVEA